MHCYNTMKGNNAFFLGNRHDGFGIILILGLVMICVYYLQSGYFTNVILSDMNIYDEAALNLNETKHIYRNIGASLEEKYHIKVDSPYMFPYIIDNPRLCSSADVLHHIILVSSKPKHAFRRKLLRKTWAAQNFMANYPSRTIFVMGNAVNNAASQADLEEENNKYGDIVQADFKDSRENLTLKLLVGIKWVLTHCNHTKYVFKATENMIVDIFTLVDLISGKLPSMSVAGKVATQTIDKRKNHKDDYGGDDDNDDGGDDNDADDGDNDDDDGNDITCNNSCPTNHSKSLFKAFSNYVQSDFFIMSGDLLPELYRTAITIQYVWSEEVFITGICLQNLKEATLVNLREHYLYHRMDNFIKQYQLKGQTKRYFCNVIKDLYLYDIAWNGILNHLTNVSKIRYGVMYNLQHAFLTQIDTIRPMPKFTKKTSNNSPIFNITNVTNPIFDKPKFPSMKKSMSTETAKQSRLPHFTNVGITLEEKYSIGINDSFMFPYLINNPSLCSPHDVIHHVILVASAPKHFDRRVLFRKTWAKQNQMRSFPGRTIYVIGNPYDAVTQAKIVQENQKYGDIIQTDFQDSYYNLTFVVLVGIKWVMTHCNQTKYVLKANDDVLIDIFNLMNLLDAVVPSMGMAGKIAKKRPILRDYGNKTCLKWCVALNDYAHLKSYPDYALGEFFIYRGDLLPVLYQTAITIPYFWIEDVYVTGICVKTIKGATQVDLGKYYLYYKFRDFVSQYKLNAQNGKYFCNVGSYNESTWTKIVNHLTLTDRIKYGLNAGQETRSKTTHPLT